MKEALKLLKVELKNLASVIRTVKFNTRQDQSSFDKKYPLKHDWEQYKVLCKNEEFIQTRNECWTNTTNLYKAYFEYRSKHIAYCLLRGRTMEQIEGKHRDPNDPTHKQVRQEADKIIKQVNEGTYGKPKEDIRPSGQVPVESTANSSGGSFVNKLRNLLP